MTVDPTPSVRRLDRRHFLRYSGLIGGGLVLGGPWLAGCGGGDGSGSASTAAVDTPDQAAVSTATGELKLLGWQYYETPALNTDQVSAAFTYLTTSTELFTKTQQERSFDLVVSNSAALPRFLELDRLVTLDPSAIAGFDALIPQLRDSPALRDSEGNLKGVPLAWSFGYTMWDPAKASGPTGFDDLLDSSLTGQIGIMDDYQGIFPFLARVNGFESPDRITPDQLVEMESQLEQLKPQIKTIHPFGEEVNLFARGEIAMELTAYGPSVFLAKDAGANVEWKFFGSATFLDALSVLPGAPLPASYSYLENSISEPAQKAIAETSLSYPVLASANVAVPDILRYDDITEVLSQAPIREGFPLEDSPEAVGEQTLIEAWDRFKASL